jgi:DNA-directed RNA polymerase subunit K/omega
MPPKNKKISKDDTLKRNKSILKKKLNDVTDNDDELSIKSDDNISSDDKSEEPIDDVLNNDNNSFNEESDNESSNINESDNDSFKENKNDEDDNNENDDNDNNDDDDDDDNDDNEETMSKKCYKKYVSMEDDINLDDIFEDETNITKTDRLTKPILTKYERVRILSTRIKQLAQGAKPMLKNYAGLSSKEMAFEELKHKIIPIIIERPVPNVGIEKWKLSELEILD